MTFLRREWMDRSRLLFGTTINRSVIDENSITPSVSLPEAGEEWVVCASVRKHGRLGETLGRGLSKVMDMMRLWYSSVIADDYSRQFDVRGSALKFLHSTHACGPEQRLRG
jgi:hypothetical protein